MGLLSGISSVLNSDAVAGAVKVGNSVDVGGWGKAAGYATKAFNWMGDNPEITNVLGGIAMGAASGYMQNQQAEEQRVFDREMYDKRNEDRYAKPGEIGNYGNYGDTIAGKGNITDGMITGEG